jgi:hypothetical protein
VRAQKRLQADRALGILLCPKIAPNSRVYRLVFLERSASHVAEHDKSAAAVDCQKPVHEQEGGTTRIAQAFLQLQHFVGYTILEERRISGGYFVATAVAAAGSARLSSGERAPSFRKDGPSTTTAAPRIWRVFGL